MSFCGCVLIQILMQTQFGSSKKVHSSNKMFIFLKERDYIFSLLAPVLPDEQCGNPEKNEVV